MADGGGALVPGVIKGIVDAGDGDGLGLVPVAGGEGEFVVADGGDVLVVAGEAEGDVVGGFGVQDDRVGAGAAAFDEG